MCGKRDQRPIRDASREREWEPEREPHRREEPWRNTRPRGNPATDRRDMERSLERLESLVGR